MNDKHDFNKYLQQTLDITREITLGQMQKQWEKVRNYDYRINKLNQLISIGFVSTFILLTPIYAYREISTMIKEYKYYLEKESQKAKYSDEIAPKGNLQNIVQ